MPDCLSLQPFLPSRRCPHGPRNPRAKSQVDCTALAAFAVQHGTVTTADYRADGYFDEAADIDGKPRRHVGLPPFCRVRGTSSPSSDSKIGFEVWLPLSGWTGRLHMIGNGAYSDRIYYDQMAARLRAGEVAVATDTGHEGGGSPGSACWPSRSASSTGGIGRCTRVSSRPRR